MMALPYGASQREVDDAWLVAAHRTLFRLDPRCHHADLCYLALKDSRELPQAKLASPSLRPGPAAMPLPPAIGAAACGRC